MGTAILHTFNAEGGDCVCLFLKNEAGDGFHIMIDCGSYTDEVKEYVTGIFHNKIDLLVVTHIDKDHIYGFGQMLTKEKDLVVGKILFNCYQKQTQNAKVADSSMQAKIDRLADNLPPVADKDNQKVSAEQAILLSKAICERPEYRNVWHEEYITEDTPDMQLRDVAGNDFGKLIFLSPNISALSKLDKEFEKSFLLKFYKRKDVDYTSDSSIFELLALIAESEKDETELNERISGTEYTREGLEKLATWEAEDKSSSNLASLAFIWECGDTRILFLGDANIHQVVGCLKRKYPIDNLPLAVNAVKISHHGSRYSTTKEFLNSITTNCYIFTGGNATDRPHESTIAKIIVQPETDGLIPILHFNFRNDTTETFVNMPSVQKEALKFNATYDQPNEFRY